MSASSKAAAGALRSATSPWRARHNPWVVALTVTIATFMEVLDTSIANVALPHIAGGLSAGVDESTWVLTSYLVSNAIVLPMSAWLSTLMGRKRFYMSCVALFTVSSMLCGMAPTLSTLILFRVLQGVGGGGLQPSEQAILADTFEPEKRGMAFAVYGMAVVLAPAIGPTLGGWITDNFDWRWIFFINFPVGILSLILTSRVVEDPPHLTGEGERISIDYWGIILITLGLGALQVVLDKGERLGWLQSNFIVTLSVIAVVGLVAFSIWEWFHKHPLVEIRLLKRRNFAAGSVMMTMLGLTFFASTVVMPLYLQNLLGYSAEQAGMVLSPGGLAILAMLPLVAFLMTRVDARWLIAIGFGSVALGLYNMTNIDLQMDFRTAVLYRIYQTSGLAFLFVPISTLAYAGMPPEKNNQLSAMINLFRNIGGSVGISVASTLIARRAQVHQDTLVTHATDYDQAFRHMFSAFRNSFASAGASKADAAHRAYGQIYGVVQQQANAQAYVDTIFLLAIGCALMIPLVLLMQKVKPGEIQLGH